MYHRQRHNNCSFWSSKKEFLEQDVSPELEQLMEDKEVYNSKDNSDTAMPITKNGNQDRKNNAQIVYPIISNGDSIGTVILMSKEANKKMNEVEQKVGSICRNFLRNTNGYIKNKTN